MPLWRIPPVVYAADSRWQGRRIWQEVVVRAPNAAFARLTARQLDVTPAWRRLGNETHSFRSGFEDEKLYWVRRVGPTEASTYRSAEPADGAIVVARMSNCSDDAAVRHGSAAGP